MKANMTLISIIALGIIALLMLQACSKDKDNIFVFESSVMITTSEPFLAFTIKDVSGNTLYYKTFTNITEMNKNIVYNAPDKNLKAIVVIISGVGIQDATYRITKNGVTHGFSLNVTSTPESITLYF